MKTVEGRRGEREKKKLLRGYSKEKGEGREQQRGGVWWLGGGVGGSGVLGQETPLSARGRALVFPLPLQHPATPGGGQLGASSLYASLQRNTCPGLGAKGEELE